MKRFIVFALVLALLCGAPAGVSGQYNRQAYPVRLESAHFIVRYATEGPDAVKPDFARQVSESAETIYDRLVTKGGLRPPRVLPVTLVLQGDKPSSGGAAHSADFGYDLYVLINPQMSDGFDLDEVLAHEFFHVLQASYNKGGDRPQWGTEGTAMAAAVYAADKPFMEFSDSLRGYFGANWSMHDKALREMAYPLGLFWYTLADRYGKLTFLRRTLAWSELFGWERAAQLAAIEGGAPVDTTFDSLWREYVFALVDGHLPEAYRAESWFHPEELVWSGRAVRLSTGRRAEGVTQTGLRFTYAAPFMLPPYSFEIVRIDSNSFLPVDVTVSGDHRSLGAFVIAPGPAVQHVLQDASLGPRHERPAAPPTDPKTVAAPLPFGKAMRLPGTPQMDHLLLVMRWGNWGSGTFSVQLSPAGRTSQEPHWAKLTDLPRSPDSAATPPPLTEEELAALTSGEMAEDLNPLVVEVSPTAVREVQVTLGKLTAQAGETTIELPFAPSATEKYGAWLPVRPVVEALGGKLEGYRITLDGVVLDLTPGSDTLLKGGRVYGLTKPVRLQDGELAADLSLFRLLGCQASWRGDVLTLSLGGR